MKNEKRDSKPKAKYPFIAFRPSSPLQEQRIRRLAEKTGLTISQIIQECLAAGLPALEKHAQGN